MPASHVIMGRSERRREALSEIRTAIRIRFYHEAQDMLISMGSSEMQDAECLSLLGVTCEAAGQWKLARRLYSKALRADHGYLPAQQNLRRLYELYTFGHSAEPVALGDERPALAMLLRHRARHDSSLLQRSNVA